MCVCERERERVVVCVCVVVCVFVDLLTAIAALVCSNCLAHSVLVY